jgi:hypothetical protein
MDGDVAVFDDVYNPTRRTFSSKNFFGTRARILKAIAEEGDELPSPVVRLRRFQVLECRRSSGDNTVIDRDRENTHTHIWG